jgi:hypothetical protein
MITTEITSKKFTVGKLVRYKKKSGFKVLHVEQIGNENVASFENILSKIQNCKVYKNLLAKTVKLQKNSSEYNKAMQAVTHHAITIIEQNGYTKQEFYEASRGKS